MSSRKKRKRGASGSNSKPAKSFVNKHAYSPNHYMYIQWVAKKNSSKFFPKFWTNSAQTIIVATTNNIIVHIVFIVMALTPTHSVYVLLLESRMGIEPTT